MELALDEIVREARRSPMETCMNNKMERIATTASDSSDGACRKDPERFYCPVSVGLKGSNSGVV